MESSLHALLPVPYVTWFGSVNVETLGPSTSKGTRSFLSRYAYQLSVGGLRLRTGSPELVTATAHEITAARMTAAQLDHGSLETFNRGAR